MIQFWSIRLTRKRVYPTEIVTFIDLDPLTKQPKQLLIFTNLLRLSSQWWSWSYTTEWKHLVKRLFKHNSKLAMLKVKCGLCIMLVWYYLSQISTLEPADDSHESELLNRGLVHRKVLCVCVFIFVWSRHKLGRFRKEKNSSENFIPWILLFNCQFPKSSQFVILRADFYATHLNKFAFISHWIPILMRIWISEICSSAWNKWFNKINRAI